jgi:hypothetical protein
VTLPALAVIPVGAFIPLLFGIVRHDAFFLIRQHTNLPFEPIGPLEPISGVSDRS